MDKVNDIRRDLTDAMRASALLVTLRISQWSGKISDLKAVAKLKEESGAKGNIGEFRKNLLTGCDGPLKVAQSAYGAVRSLHYAKTVPYVIDPSADVKKGPRLLASADADSYMKSLGQAKRMAEQQRDALCEVYEDLVTTAQANLGGLADASNYPDVERIREAFDIKFEFSPIPQTANFPELPDDLLRRYSKTLENKQKRAAKIGREFVWKETREHLTHLYERLQPDVKFKSASLEHVQGLVSRLYAFAFFDPRMTEISTDIGNMVGGVTAKDLRDKVIIREDVAEETKKIIDKLDRLGV